MDNTSKWNNWYNLSLSTQLRHHQGQLFLFEVLFLNILTFLLKSFLFCSSNIKNRFLIGLVEVVYLTSIKNGRSYDNIIGKLSLFKNRKRLFQSITEIILAYRWENGPVLPLLPKEDVIQVIKWPKNNVFNKLNQHAWVNVGVNIQVFVITTLGMRVNPSLLVFNL